MIDIAIAVVLTAVVTFFVTWYVFQKGTLAHYEKRVKELRAELIDIVDKDFEELGRKAEKEIRDHEAFNIAKGKLIAAKELKETFATMDFDLKPHLFVILSIMRQPSMPPKLGD